MRVFIKVVRKRFEWENITEKQVVLSAAFPHDRIAVRISCGPSLNKKFYGFTQTQSGVMPQANESLCDRRDGIAEP